MNCVLITNFDRKCANVGSGDDLLSHGTFYRLAVQVNGTRSQERTPRIRLNRAPAPTNRFFATLCFISNKQFCIKQKFSKPLILDLQKNRLGKKSLYLNIWPPFEQGISSSAFGAVPDVYDKATRFRGTRVGLLNMKLFKIFDH